MPPVDRNESLESRLLSEHYNVLIMGMNSSEMTYSGSPRDFHEVRRLFFSSSPPSEVFQLLSFSVTVGYIHHKCSTPIFLVLPILIMYKIYPNALKTFSGEASSTLLEGERVRSWA